MRGREPPAQGPRTNNCWRSYSLSHSPYLLGVEAESRKRVSPPSQHPQLITIMVGGAAGLRQGYGAEEEEKEVSVASGTTGELTLQAPQRCSIVLSNFCYKTDE